MTAPRADLAIEHLLRVVASAATRGSPLPEALDAYGSPLARNVAQRLRAGATLPDAVRQELGDELADLLAGPQPPVDGAALLVAEHLRLRRQERLDQLATLFHPLLTLVTTAIAVPLILRVMGQPPALVWLSLAIVLVIAAILLPICAGRTAIARHLPALAMLNQHATLAQRYERAALVARWRLSEARLAPFLGEDLAAIAPVLSAVGAEDHCRRLASYHREAQLRARHRLHRTIQVLVLLAGGALVLAAGAGIVPSIVEATRQVTEAGSP